MLMLSLRLILIPYLVSVNKCRKVSVGCSLYLQGANLLSPPWPLHTTISWLLMPWRLRGETYVIRLACAERIIATVWL